MFNITNNDIKSDDEEVASYVPSLYLFFSLSRPYIKMCNTGEQDSPVYDYPQWPINELITIGFLLRGTSVIFFPLSTVSLDPSTD